MHLLQTFLSRQIQALRRRRTKMWTYSGPSCLDHPSSKELSAAEMEARIHKVLDLRVNMNPGPGPVALWRGIASVRVGTLGPISTTFMIIFFHYARDLAQGLGGGCDKPWDADSPSDATMWEARHASSEETRVHEERERDRCAAEWVAKRWGTEASPRSASSGEGEVERGATLPPLSPPPPRMTPSPHREVVPLQTGSTAGERRPKHPPR
jgi:hypothetical protein